jgi:hypothetical protein
MCRHALGGSRAGGGDFRLRGPQVGLTTASGPQIRLGLPGGSGDERCDDIGGLPLMGALGWRAKPGRDEEHAQLVAVACDS